MSNILVLGDGLLGSEIVRQTGWDYISRKKNGFDFCNIRSFDSYLNRYWQVVNCIGYTKTYDMDRQIHWNTNFKAVSELAEYCFTENIKLTHVSTDYVYSGSVENASEEDLPIPAPNWYSYSKLLADSYIQTWHENNYLITRCSFKPRPFPYDKGITTQKGNFDYVDTIASLIIQLIRKGACGLYNVGTETKTIYDLALQTKPDVIPWDIKLHPTMPENITMDISKMERFLNG